MPPSTTLASGVVVFLEADSNRGEYQGVIFARCKMQHANRIVAGGRAGTSGCAPR